MPPTQLAGPAPSAVPVPTQPAADPALSGPINDRWFTTTPTPWPDPPNNGAASAPAPTVAPSALSEQPARATESDPVETEVVASMEPAIAGAVPKPRPKPPANTVSARLREPPLPRPRPDGPAPQSVWTAAPVTDDRFPAASQ
jgi:hypothetical protein